MIDTPEVPSGSGPSSPVASPSPMPASSRPGEKAPTPVPVDTIWYDRLRDHLDIDALLAASRACHRGRHYTSSPEWADIYPRLKLAEAMLTDAVRQHPESATLAEYSRQVRVALYGH